MLPSAEELERLQQDLESVCLPDTCNILSGTYASDGQGGWTATWGTATRRVRCRFDSLQGSEVLAGAAPQTFGRFVVTLPHDTVITTSHRIEHGGIQYNVVALDNDKSWNASRRAIVEAV